VVDVRWSNVVGYLGQVDDMRVGFTHWVDPHGVIESAQEDSAWGGSVMRSVPHLEGILLAIDVGIEISEWVGSISTELCLAGVTDPGGDVVPAEIVAVVAVHENINRFFRRWAE